MHLIQSAIAALAIAASPAPLLDFPTANRSLLQRGGEAAFYVGTAGKPWASGTFGCVRSEGHQMHEGIDIRCLMRDGRGEPLDPILCTAEGEVVYVNPAAGLSNYGIYVVVRHSMDGLEVYSLYAHLRSVEPGVVPGARLRRGQRLGTMGRTANTRQEITRDRAHLHFELNLMLNPGFARWHEQALPGHRNDHGSWNGMNLVAMDAGEILRKAHEHPSTFSLLDHIREQKALLRVQVRSTHFSFLHRHPQLVHRNGRKHQGEPAGYAIAFNFNGLPFELIPLRAADLKGTERVELLSVDAAEHRRHPCRDLVQLKGKSWTLTEGGRRLVELMLFSE